MTQPNSSAPNSRSHKGKNSRNRVKDGEDAEFLDGLGITRKRTTTSYGIASSDEGSERKRRSRTGQCLYINFGKKPVSIIVPQRTG
ncbi:hypothetical protein CRE_24841 [Caenorhabditis remanei]|uniref:Uncharacterized protein n=1 Tax=Caenorhabditis remanei TaxID=31234 RepID=E3NJ29_CAERE|nr:hypothetical protein CRE_24841 [Caenorhabditis remanei]